MYTVVRALYCTLQTIYLGFCIVLGYCVRKNENKTEKSIRARRLKGLRIDGLQVTDWRAW
uniref:Uncharacterized protein n=1 Tax=Ciona intestinalis TaxID=7719 RepID=H2XW83_CIOIN